MGQKTHPYGFRLGYTRTWNSRWYSKKDYVKQLHEDIEIRRVVKTRLFHAGISKVEFISTSVCSSNSFVFGAFGLGIAITFEKHSESFRAPIT